MSLALAYTITSSIGEVEELIQGCIRNERGAQEKIYRLFYPKMFALVRRYIDQEAQAEEVMNNGFLRAFKKVQQYTFQGSFEGWLRKIVFHAVADYVKRNTNYSNNVVLDDKEQFVDKDQTDKLYYDQLLKLVHALPDGTKAVFNMYVMEGYNHREIAGILGISQGTSKWHLSEARKILKDQVEKLELHLTM